MTSTDFSAADFEPCDAPPPCWLREPGPFYTRTQAGSTAFVRYLAAESSRHDEIEAFGGNWQQPWATGHCWGGGVTTTQLVQRLS